MLRRLVVVPVVATLVAVLTSTGAHAATTVTPASATHLCGLPAPGKATCFAEKYAGITPHVTVPYGYGPADLQSAYALPSASGGNGQVVYIIDAYDAPTAEADLATYRSQYGLPACTTANGCFKKLNQAGAASPLPAYDAGWAGEIALDLDMVSAVCPNCGIRLIESNDSGGGLYTAIHTAVGLGAKYVSMSWGGPEYSGETQADSTFTSTPGVLFSVSTGDSGWAGGVSYPAASPAVLAVGGTSLHTSTSTRGWSESAWGGAGSGCSAYEPKPSWQAFIPSSVCSGRALADVSAVADPNTGVAVYHGGWGMYGGTSASAPIVAAAYALAGATSTVNPASFPYSNTNHVNDVSAGSTGSCGTILCTAAAGWDGPTGLGTPAGIGALNGTGSSTPVTTVLTGTVAPVSGVAGLPIPVAATAYPPSGATVTGVAWTAGRADCTFSAATSLSTSVTCNASATGASTVSVKLTASTGATKTISAPLTFTASATPRATSTALSVDGQSGTAAVCTGVAVPVVARVVDTATGQPVKGMPEAFTSTPATGLTTALGSTVSAGDGTAARAMAFTAATTLAASATATGSFAASAVSRVPVSIGVCSPHLSAASSASTVWYGESVTMSGSLTRVVGSATLPMSGLRVALTLVVPPASVGGLSTTLSLGSAVTGANGAWSAAVRPTASGTLRAAVAASAGVSAAFVSAGSVSVATATSTLTASASTPGVMYGVAVPVTGSLTRQAAASVGVASATVTFSLVADGTTTSVPLGSAVTTASGSFSASVVPRASGHVWAKYATVAGTTGSTADLGEITATPWTTSLTLSSSAASVLTGGTVTYRGVVTRTGTSGSSPAPSVAVKLFLQPANGGSPISLGQATTSATGAYALVTAMRGSGTVVAMVSGFAGYLNATSAGVPITVS